MNHFVDLKEIVVFQNYLKFKCSKNEKSTFEIESFKVRSFCVNKNSFFFSNKRHRLPITDTTTFVYQQMHSFKSFALKNMKSFKYKTNTGILRNFSALNYDLLNLSN